MPTPALAKNKSALKIILLGSGNVATQLGTALQKAGYPILMVYSPTTLHAQQLARKLNCAYTNSITAISQNAQLYIIAVKDDAIGSLAKKLTLKNKLIVHTSGSVNMNILTTPANNYGVLYPLQTISKQKKINFKKVPFCIEASNDKTEKLLTTLAKTISTSVYRISSKQRLIIHLSAVFACNFSNYLYTIAETILTENNINFDLLKPLIIETAAKIHTASPRNLQTGPAARGDVLTINNHLKLLSNKRRYRKLYKLISENIIKESE